MARFRFALPISLIFIFTLHFVAAAPGGEPEGATALATPETAAAGMSDSSEASAAHRADMSGGTADASAKIADVSAGRADVSTGTADVSTPGKVGDAVTVERRHGSSPEMSVVATGARRETSPVATADVSSAPLQQATPAQPHAPSSTRMRDDVGEFVTSIDPDGGRDPAVAAAPDIATEPAMATALAVTGDPGSGIDPASAIDAIGSGVHGHAAAAAQRRQSNAIRGLYLSGWAAGVRLSETVEYMLEHDLNTIVLDIKDTDGRLSFALPGTVANALGANAFKMGSPERVQQALQYFREDGMHVVGRLVLFQDNFLPHQHPEWALRLPTGDLWRDPSGNTWLDPTRPEVFDYHVEIAIAAARLGFDEIQFDYIRYPEHRVVGYNDGTQQQRVATITEFAAAARRRIQAEVDVPVSGAIYGIIAVSEADHNLGQDLIELTDALDYISPMFYPSHYIAGDFSLADPNSEPYKTLFASTAAALARTDASQWTQLRPWIQSFFGYDKEQVEDQIRALKDLGVDSFFVWNPSGRYVPGVDYHLAEEGDGHFANSPFRTALYPLMSPAAGVFVPDPALKLPLHFTNESVGAENGWYVHAQRKRGGYRVELWRDAGDAGDTPGERIVTVQRSPEPRSQGGAQIASTSEGEEPADPESRDGVPVVAEADGFTLVWAEAGYEWQLWARSHIEALEAQRSLRPVPRSLF